VPKLQELGGHHRDSHSLFHEASAAGAADDGRGGTHRYLK